MKKRTIIIIICSCSFAALITAAACFLMFNTWIPRGTEFLGTDLWRAGRSDFVNNIITEHKNSLASKTIEINADDRKLYINLSEIDIDYAADEIFDQAEKHSKSLKYFDRLLNAFDIGAEKMQLTPIIIFDEKKLTDVVAKLSNENIIKSQKGSYKFENSKVFVTNGSAEKYLDSEEIIKQLSAKIKENDFSPLSTKYISRAIIPVSFDEIKKEVKIERDFYLTDNEEDIIYRGFSESDEAIKKKLNSGETFEISVVSTKAAEKNEATAECSDLIAFCQTKLINSNANRTHNVKKALESFNGKILAPGEVFSYGEALGLQSTATGYKYAGAYSGSGVIQAIGGGICQGSSTLYNCALKADLKILKRSAHSYTVPYVPLAQDAAFDQRYQDFRFENNTEHPIKIVAYISGTNVRIKFYGTKDKSKTIKLESKKLSVETGSKAELYMTRTVNGVSERFRVNTSTYKPLPR